MILMFLLDLVDLRYILDLRNLVDRQVRRAYHQDGDKEEPGNTSRER